MAGIRSLSYIVDKYKRVTPGKAKELEEGIKSPKKIWHDETVAAKDAYEAGVQEAISTGAREAGIEQVGQAGYIEMAIKKGPKRYREGVELGLPKYNKNFAPYRDTIAATELPPRKAKGDPGNIDRVAAIAAALHDTKLMRRRGR